MTSIYRCMLTGLDEIIGSHDLYNYDTIYNRDLTREELLMRTMVAVMLVILQEGI